MEGVIILIIILIISIAARLILGYSPLNSSDEKERNEEPWSYENCTYRGDCLTDCCLRDKCPYYSYKDE